MGDLFAPVEADTKTAQEVEAVSVERFSVISANAGFALMKMPALLNAAYERSPSAEGAREGLKALQAALKNVDPAQYRGIDRCPLCEDPIPEPGWAATPEHVALDDRDVGPRIRMLDFVGTSNRDYYGPTRCVVPTVENAHELMALVDLPSEYEIVRLSQSAPGEMCKGDTGLGFDIGCWGSDSYSIICDSAVWPRWHGPAGDVFDELAKQLADLNSYCLFQTYEAAERFRSWYRTRDWAEREGEPGEFCIIKIEAVCAK